MPGKSQQEIELRLVRLEAAKLATTLGITDAAQFVTAANIIFEFIEDNTVPGPGNGNGNGNGGNN